MGHLPFHIQVFLPPQIVQKNQEIQLVMEFLTNQLGLSIRVFYIFYLFIYFLFLYLQEVTGNLPLGITRPLLVLKSMHLQFLCLLNAPRFMQG